MKRKTLLAVLLCALGLVACGSSEQAPAPGAAPTAPAAAAPAAPAAPLVSPPGMLVPGAVPTTVQAAAVPAVSLTVERPAEVQIDAMGQPDAQLLLLRDGTVVAEDSDSGEGADARLVLFLAAGTYEARVSEWRGRAMEARIQAQVLPPLTPVGAVTPDGRPQTVQAPAGDMRRAASVELTLTIRNAGNYRIDVMSAPDAGRDAELLLTRDDAVIAEDSDSGEGNHAQITRQLEPGTYRVRVRDWVNRAAALTVSVTPV